MYRSLALVQSNLNKISRIPYIEHFDSRPLIHLKVRSYWMMGKILLGKIQGIKLLKDLKFGL